MQNKRKGIDVNKTIKEAHDELVKESLEDKGYFWEAFRETSDRGLVIVMGNVLDNLLKRLIKAAYIQDNKVTQIFKEEKILGTALAKIKIAYFSGYIPKYIYQDLVIINNIRNKFAHEIEISISFKNEPIKTMVDNCVLAYEPFAGCSTRIKYLLVVTQIYSILGTLEKILKKRRPWHLMEIYPLNEANFKEWRLTEEELKEALKKA